MQVQYIEDITTFYDFSVKDVCLGFFDGVHVGHQSLISKFLKSSNDKKYVITFEDHISKKPITSLDQKLNIFTTLGVTNVLILKATNFTKTKEEFINFLENINVSNIFVGSDYKFGLNANGNVDDLSEYFKVEVLKFACLNELKVSSSDIRLHIRAGEFDLVHEKLGREYELCGEVLYGKQIGRTINFPTANLSTNCILPENGIYITSTTVCGKIYPSVTNIGVRPSIIDDNQITVETYIIDFDQEIYGYEIQVSFKKKIREEMKFESLGELKNQIQKDLKKTREYYGN